MSDRDCENCKHHTEKGCDSRDCNFERRMADIELVVKIDTERYEAIKKHNGIPTVSDGVDAADAILNGTPLPKGHGRLIDADVFEKRLMDARLYYVGEKADDFDLRFAAGLKSAAERLVDAPTIIEADKAESEE